MGLFQEEPLLSKILLIGGGSIGKRHLGNLIRSEVSDFVVVDPREERRREAIESARKAMESLEGSERYPQPLNVVAVSSSEEAYRLGHRFEAVVIAAPPRFHSEEIRRALANRVHIFCEKPLAKDDEPWEELNRLAEEVEAVQLVGMVGYNYRFLPQLRQVRQMIDQGVVGRVLSVRGTFSQNLWDWHPWEGLNFFMSSKALGGGVLLEETHLVDICRWLFGEITHIMAYNGTISSLKDEPSLDVDDLVEMIVHFQSGAMGSLHMDLFGRYHQKRLEVIGEEATLFWQYDATDIESNGIQVWKGKRVRMSPDFTRRVPEQVIATDWEVRNSMYLEEIRYFLNSKKAGWHLRGDVPDLRDGLKTIGVARAARRSAHTGRLEPVEPIRELLHGSV